MPERICINCGKPLTKRYQVKFCCQSCAATFNNRARQTTTKGKQKLAHCIVCGKEFWASIHINAGKCRCENCKKHNRPHYNENPKSILDMSKRTMTKLIQRAKMGCSICGWDDAQPDVHHIIPRCEGGSNDNSNLIIVCPNCHRVIHTTNKYTREYLETLSIDKTFTNWKDYYHTER